MPLFRFSAWRRYDGGVVHVVAPQEVRLELPEQAQAVAIARAPEVGRELARAIRARELGAERRAQDLDVAFGERRTLALEGAVVGIEANLFEPAVIGALGRAQQLRVDRIRIAAREGVEEAEVRRVRARRGAHFAAHVLREEFRPGARLHERQ
jgi:hypothetical protein